MFRSIAISLLLMTGSISIASQPSQVTKENVSAKEDQALTDLWSQMTEEEKEYSLAFFELDWKGPGTYQLSSSKSTLSIPEGYSLLIGQEAKKIEALNNQPISNNIEAIVYDDALENVVYFENYKKGYVSLKDWNTINPKLILEQISKNTEEGNKERRKNKGEELHVVGWIQEPTLDKHTNTVYWALEAESGNQKDGNIVNSVALRLGREGIEKLIWVSPIADYVPFGGKLDIMLRAHSFNPGYRYTDYTKGDKVATYGIATLVAATVGAKIVKVGGIAVLFKKIGGFIIVGFSALLYKIRNVFRRKEKR